MKGKGILSDALSKVTLSTHPHIHTSTHTCAQVLWPGTLVCHGISSPGLVLTS